MQETYPSYDRPAPRTHVRPALRLKRFLLLFPIVLPLSIALPAHAVDTPAAPVTAASTPEASPPPTLDTIVIALRNRFHVAYADARTIARAVQTESDRYGLAPALLLAIIAVESGFDRHAVSVAGARGLMQVMPAAHRDLVAHVKDLSDPATNVRIGAAIFRGYLDDADGDVETALVRYNGGTRRYAQRVALRVQQFDAQLRRSNGAASDELRTAANP
ncbi:MAG: Membrane-bound lytic murein transglycosylase C [Burkholderia lata]|uniref:Membrane-bound lytic murein transglycosylase C n=1 Tax=Burkholderia lata (strain ATCC 17760 / DSM 23089 / LMG 22485 / NCIMB 9086 / R18194 / 383) TaxID=482957 RepID=A0A833U5N7_BURL3|nr:transglycosylase SLT domain-containing protein [Burkholderia lata]KAF1033628.1 MAG: Membrane-bound lytic murein transglycosylase C [Burkholderia lata]